jgi:two-component system, response regulator PdtaR
MPPGAIFVPKTVRGDFVEKKQLRVILAEDESIIALDLKRKLESFGYKVLCTVRSGEAAIAKTEELRPDLMIVDVGLMGKISGISAVTTLRLSMHLPVVFVTAYSDDATKNEMMRIAPVGFVAKPIATSELRSSIEQVLRL